MTLKRPKAKENEDDLLRMQEEFLQSNTKPSVNISSSDQSINQNRSSKRATSKFALSKKLKTKDDPNSEKAPSSFILGNIVERNASEQFYPEFKNEATGFPSIFISEESKATKNESLFMQAVSKEKPSREEKIDVKFEDYGLMTEEDILREKRKLESTLNPSLIEFIKRRRREKERSDSRIEEEKEKLEFRESSTEAKSEALPEMIKEILTEAKKNNWVHMDVVEKEKAKWMEDVGEGKKVDFNEPYNARFDFNGVLMPFNDDNITIDKGLHHHGDEPERPGYSLQELLQLTRSSSLQQRSIALQTLANIIEKSRRGWYDSVLQPAPLSALNERNILLLLRFAIDDSSTPVVTAALQAMRNFLYNEEDEVCLDRYFGLDGFSEPILKPDLNTKDFDSLKDHELAQLDTVATCFRSDLVPRLRYILSDMHPPPIGVSCALEILTRLCRHSMEMALNILSVRNLLEIVGSNFVPLTSCKLISQENVTDAYGVPMISALRFFRVLITYAGRPAVEEVCRLNLVASIISYLGSEAGSSGTFLYIECLRLWKLILLHGFTHDALSWARIILRSQERICFEKLNIGDASELFCEHAAALLSVVSHEDSFRGDVLLSLKKWSTQLSSCSTPTWGNMKLILHVLLALEEFSEGSFQLKWLLNSKIFESLSSTSNLLSGLTNAKERSPSSLPSLGALAENGQLQPLLSQSSSFSFLSQALQFFTTFSHRTEIELFFAQGDFIKYIASLTTSEWSLENSWFTRVEFNFLTRVIKTARGFQDLLSEKMKSTLWMLSMKLISALPADFYAQTREILHYMLDPEKMSVQEILSNLQDLNLVKGNKISVNLSIELIAIYESYIPVKGNWGQTALPKDWIFLPLIDTYRNLKISHQLEKKDVEKIAFVLNLYLGLPELVENLTPNLQFSRLILVFLCGTVFNDKNISPLIESVMSTFFRKHNKTLDLTKDVPGLSSFTDMFTALCENFFSHSYGNNYFTLVLLTFISQRQDVHYRKMLWSEHAGTLRYIRITVDKLLCSLDEFLYPIETDVSLINCYISSLLWGTVKKEWCSLPYIIALHHSGMFLKNSNQLAVQMKSRLEKLERSEIIDKILNYDPTGIK